MIRAFASLIPTIGLSVLGAEDAKPWEQKVFAAAAVVTIAIVFFDVRRRMSLVEHVTVRRRLHRVLVRIAEGIFKDDDSIELTIFLPDTMDGSPNLVPVTRFSVDNKTDISPRSKSVFTPKSSTIIREAWVAPGTISFVNVPLSFKNDDAARGWFQSELEFPEAEAKRLSRHTLHETKCIANVAIASPLSALHPIALLAITSNKPKRLSPAEFTQDMTDELTKYLEVIGLMLSPV